MSISSNEMRSSDSTVGAQDSSGQQQSSMGPMTLSEILTAVLWFLDQRSLRSCRLVSKFWWHHSNYILGQACTVDCNDVAKVLLFPDFTLSEKQQWTVDQFQLNSPLIRHLHLGTLIELNYSFVSSNQYSCPRPAPHMTSLLSLSIGHPESSSVAPQTSVMLEKTICDLIRNSPRLREIAFRFYPPGTKIPMVEQVLKSTGPSLRKITVQGAPRVENLGYLLQLLCEREHEWQQSIYPGNDQKPRATIQSTCSDPDSNRKLSSTAAVGYQQESLARTVRSSHHLEELVIFAGPEAFANIKRDVCLESIQGQLSIKSLSIVDTCIFQGDDVHHELKRRLLLAILRRCPQLEELRYGSDFITQYNSYTFGNFSVTYRKRMKATFNNSITPTRDWIWDLFKACPKLKKIDLGGSTTREYDYLDEVLEAHMGQLESIVLWGLEIKPTRPLEMVFRPGVLDRLAELNISGSIGFEEAIPAVLKSAPNLKQLLAMSVQVSAEDIIGFDWICTNLVHLALNVSVPRDISPSEESDFRHFIRTNADDDTALPGRISYNNALQIMICQQLGRLTKLRELKLEGPSCMERGRGLTGEDDCMLLTMKTGLPYLEPLRSSLELLDLCQLNEMLSGRQEVEWIAQHWIHHRHPELHSRLNVVHCLDGIQLKDLQAELKVLYESSPPPRLRELRGINRGSGHGSSMESGLNVIWLLSVCPTLSTQGPSRTC